MTKRGLAVCLLALAACDGAYSDDPYIPEPDPIPVAVDDDLTIAEDQWLDLAAARANDTDVNNVTVVVPPEHGRIENGKYLPDPGYFGTDQFTYEGRFRSTGLDVAVATVRVTITSDGIAYEQSRNIGSARADGLAAADLDGDGKIDLVTCDSQSNTMTIFRNTTAAPDAFSTEKSVFEGGDTPRHIRTGDIDGDGRPDIITATDGGPTIYRNITTPGGLLAFEGPRKLVASDAKAIAVVDLQGDGALDIVTTTSDYFSGSLDVWINQSSAGSISFGMRTSFSIPKDSVDLAAVDADGNGLPDLTVLANEKLSLFVNAMTIGATTPAFQARVDRDTGPEPLNMFLADLDGDTSPELGVLHGYGELWVYANRGAASPTFEAARVLEVDVSSSVITTAQIDGDALVDLVSVPNYGELRLEILANRSLPRQYAFEAKEAIVADAQTRRIGGINSPSALLYADLDGVPPTEIVISSRSYWSNSAPGLTVLYGP